MYFSHWKPPAVSERMWGVNLDASISGEYQTIEGHSCRPSEHLGKPATNQGAPATCLGVSRMTVVQSGKIIIFGKAACAPGKYSYSLSLNDCKNTSIKFVFSSMYLCIYIATHLHTVYLDWLQTVLESNSSCGWKLRSSKLWGTPRGRNRAILEMHCTRPWSSVLWGHNRATLEIHLRAVIEGV